MTLAPRYRHGRPWTADNERRAVAAFLARRSPNMEAATRAVLEEMARQIRAGEHLPDDTSTRPA
jgi:hypothetical protein